MRLDHPEYVIELARGLRGYNLEIQVFATRSAIEQSELDVEMVTEVVLDIFHHIGFCGGGQAQNGRVIRTLRSRFQTFGPILYVSPDIAVIRTKVVPPTRKAVCFVKHPSTDFALVEYPAQRTIA